MGEVEEMRWNYYAGKEEEGEEEEEIEQVIEY